MVEPIGGPSSRLPVGVHVIEEKMWMEEWFVNSLYKRYSSGGENSDDTISKDNIALLLKDFDVSVKKDGEDDKGVMVDPKMLMYNLITIEINEDMTRGRYLLQDNSSDVEVVSYSSKCLWTDLFEKFSEDILEIAKTGPLKPTYCRMIHLHNVPERYRSEEVCRFFMTYCEPFVNMKNLPERYQTSDMLCTAIKSSYDVDMRSIYMRPMIQEVLDVDLILALLDKAPFLIGGEIPHRLMTPELIDRYVWAVPRCIEYLGSAMREKYCTEEYMNRLIDTWTEDTWYYTWRPGLCYHLMSLFEKFVTQDLIDRCIEKIGFYGLMYDVPQKFINMDLCKRSISNRDKPYRCHELPLKLKPFFELVQDEKSKYVRNVVIRQNIFREPEDEKPKKLKKPKKKIRNWFGRSNKVAPMPH